MNRMIVRVMMGSGIAMMVACLSSRPVAEPGTPASESQALGSFSVASQTFGNVTVSPTACAGGDRQLFLGGDLSAPGSPVVLRLVVDPLEGPAVRLFSSEAPYDTSVVFRRADCTVFHFSLDDTGWRVNDIYDHRLTLQLECAKPGESVSGSASSTHCH
jgi:hypothetical protein